MTQYKKIMERDEFVVEITVTHRVTEISEPTYGQVHTREDNRLELRTHTRGIASYVITEKTIGNALEKGVKLLELTGE